MVLTSPPAPSPAPHPAPEPSRPGDHHHGAAPAAAATTEDAYEETHVHGVYEAIASHFSATRHKPWPLVSSFLASRAPGSVGLDVGCGNGKNMGVNGDVLMLGCDRSAALAALARDMWCSGRYRAPVGGAAGGEGTAAGGVVIQGADVAVADSLALPFREGSADFAICIAVIHHLSTRERRVDAIRQLLRCVRRGDEEGSRGGGQVLVYVWALEQGGSRRGWDEGGEQDLLVPWVMKAPPQKKEKKKRQQQQQQQAQARGQQKQGRRHKYGQGHEQGQGQGQAPHDETAENSQDSQSRSANVGGSGGIGQGGSGSGGGGTDSGGKGADQPGGGEGGDRLQEDQPRPKLEPEPEQLEQPRGGGGEADAGAAATAAAARTAVGNDGDGDGDNSKYQQEHEHEHEQGVRHADKTFHRYYHLYRKGELEEEVVAAGGKVVSSGYERDNWWVIAG